MTLDPTTVDRIVAEVTRRLRASGPPNAAAVREHSAGSSAVDLTGEAVVTGPLLADRCRPGTTVRLAAGTIVTPTAHDTIRSLQLETDVAAKATATPCEATGLVLNAEAHRNATALANRLGWPHEIVDVDDAIAKARSAICRGSATLAVLLVPRPAHAAARLNRQSNVWAVAARTLEDVRELQAGDAWNCVCLTTSRLPAALLAHDLQRLARHVAPGGTRECD